MGALAVGPCLGHNRMNTRACTASEMNVCNGATKCPASNSGRHKLQRQRIHAVSLVRGRLEPLRHLTGDFLIMDV